MQERKSKERAHISIGLQRTMNDDNDDDECDDEYEDEMREWTIMGLRRKRASWASAATRTPTITKVNDRA